MQAVTQNRITQGQHGTSKAVDYSASPDKTLYAPEDGVIDSYMQRGSGTSNAGLALRMRGANGLHQFAHTERSLVQVGQSVKRGQPIAIRATQSPLGQQERMFTGGFSAQTEPTSTHRRLLTKHL